MIRYAMNVRDRDVAANSRRSSVRTSRVCSTIVNTVGLLSIHDPVVSFISLWSKRVPTDLEQYHFAGVKANAY